MKSIKILIVEDEPLAQDVLEAYIAKLPGFEVAGKCKNALEAFSMLTKSSIDIILLDINMPEISGFELLNTIKEIPLVIFTTAYSEFAVESYEYNAVDYLLKPISFERFLKAINKAIEIMQSNNNVSVTDGNDNNANTGNKGNENIIFVKSEGKLIKIDVTKIWFIEALKDYVKFWTESGNIVVHGTMKSIEDQFMKYPSFLRVQKSFILNMNYISEIEGNVIRIKGHMVTIGNTYKEEVHKLFNSHRFL